MKVRNILLIGLSFKVSAVAIWHVVDWWSPWLQTSIQQCQRLV